MSIIPRNDSTDNTNNPPYPFALPVAGDPQKPELGEWREIRGYLKSHKNGRAKQWQHVKFPTPKRAVFVGTRRIFDGKLLYEWADGGGYDIKFEPTQEHRVWLFVFSESRNPVYVLPDDVYRAVRDASQAGEGQS